MDSYRYSLRPDDVAKYGTTDLNVINAKIKAKNEAEVRRQGIQSKLSSQPQRNATSNIYKQGIPSTNDQLMMEAPYVTDYRQGGATEPSPTPTKQLLTQEEIRRAAVEKRLAEKGAVTEPITPYTPTPQDIPAAGFPPPTPQSTTAVVNPPEVNQPNLQQTVANTNTTIKQQEAKNKLEAEERAKEVNMNPNTATPQEMTNVAGSIMGASRLNLGALFGEKASLYNKGGGFNPEHTLPVPSNRTVAFLEGFNPTTPYFQKGNMNGYDKEFYNGKMVSEGAQGLMAGIAGGFVGRGLSKFAQVGINELAQAAVNIPQVINQVNNEELTPKQGAIMLTAYTLGGALGEGGRLFTDKLFKLTSPLANSIVSGGFESAINATSTGLGAKAIGLTDEQAKAMATTQFMFGAGINIGLGSVMALRNKFNPLPPKVKAELQSLAIDKESVKASFGNKDIVNKVKNGEITPDTPIVVDKPTGGAINDVPSTEVIPNNAIDLSGADNINKAVVSAQEYVSIYDKVQELSNPMTIVPNEVKTDVTQKVIVDTQLNDIPIDNKVIKESFAKEIKASKGDKADPTAMVPAISEAIDATATIIGNPNPAAPEVINTLAGEYPEIPATLIDDVGNFDVSNAITDKMNEGTTDATPAMKMVGEAEVQSTANAIVDNFKATFGDNSLKILTTSLELSPGISVVEAIQSDLSKPTMKNAKGETVPLTISDYLNTIEKKIDVNFVNDNNPKIAQEFINKNTEVFDGLLNRKPVVDVPATETVPVEAPSIVPEQTMITEPPIVEPEIAPITKPKKVKGYTSDEVINVLNSDKDVALDYIIKKESPIWKKEFINADEDEIGGISYKDFINQKAEEKYFGILGSQSAIQNIAGGAMLFAGSMDLLFGDNKDNSYEAKISGTGLILGGLALLGGGLFGYSRFLRNKLGNTVDVTGFNRIPQSQFVTNWEVNGFNNIDDAIKYVQDVDAHQNLVMPKTQLMTSAPAQRAILSNKMKRWFARGFKYDADPKEEWLVIHNANKDNRTFTDKIEIATNDLNISTQSSKIKLQGKTGFASDKFAIMGLLDDWYFKLYSDWINAGKQTGSASVGLAGEMKRNSIIARDKINTPEYRIDKLKEVVAENGYKLSDEDFNKLYDLSGKLVKVYKLTNEFDAFKEAKRCFDSTPEQVYRLKPEFEAKQDILKEKYDIAMEEWKNAILMGNITEQNKAQKVAVAAKAAKDLNDYELKRVNIFINNANAPYLGNAAPFRSTYVTTIYEVEPDGNKGYKKLPAWGKGDNKGKEVPYKMVIHSKDELDLLKNVHEWAKSEGINLNDKKNSPWVLVEGTKKGNLNTGIMQMPDGRYIRINQRKNDPVKYFNSKKALDDIVINLVKNSGTIDFDGYNRAMENMTAEFNKMKDLTDEYLDTEVGSYQTEIKEVINNFNAIKEAGYKYEDFANNTSDYFWKILKRDLLGTPTNSNSTLNYRIFNYENLTSAEKGKHFLETIDSRVAKIKTANVNNARFSLWLQHRKYQTEMGLLGNNYTAYLDNKLAGMRLFGDGFEQTGKFELFGRQINVGQSMNKLAQITAGVLLGLNPKSIVTNELGAFNANVLLAYRNDKGLFDSFATAVSELKEQTKIPSEIIKRTSLRHSKPIDLLDGVTSYVDPAIDYSPAELRDKVLLKLIEEGILGGIVTDVIGGTASETIMKTAMIGMAVSEQHIRMTTGTHAAYQWMRNNPFDKTTHFTKNAWAKEAALQGVLASDAAHGVYNASEMAPVIAKLADKWWGKPMLLFMKPTLNHTYSWIDLNRNAINDVKMAEGNAKFGQLALGTSKMLGATGTIILMGGASAVPIIADAIGLMQTAQWFTNGGEWNQTAETIYEKLVNDGRELAKKNGFSDKNYNTFLKILEYGSLSALTNMPFSIKDDILSYGNPALLQRMDRLTTDLDKYIKEDDFITAIGKASLNIFTPTLIKNLYNLMKELQQGKVLDKNGNEIDDMDLTGWVIFSNLVTGGSLDERMIKEESYKTNHPILTSEGRQDYMRGFLSAPGIRIKDEVYKTGFIKNALLGNEDFISPGVVARTRLAAIEQDKLMTDAIIYSSEAAKLYVQQEREAIKRIAKAKGENTDMTNEDFINTVKDMTSNAKEYYQGLASYNLLNNILSTSGKNYPVSLSDLSFKPFGTSDEGEKLNKEIATLPLQEQGLFYAKNKIKYAVKKTEDTGLKKQSSKKNANFDGEIPEINIEGDIEKKMNDIENQMNNY